LIEVLIAVTLLSLLSVAMFMAMRIGLNAYTKADTRLMENRRVAGAQRILESELEGLIPVVAACGDADASHPNTMFFEGQPQAMRLVSSFSLAQGSRGQPQVLELSVIPGERNQGVRLVVNESLYTGPAGVGRFCAALSQFSPVEAGPSSFVLADKLAYCRFSYLQMQKDPSQPPLWQPGFSQQDGPALPFWPLAIRVDMAPLEAEAGRVQPISVTAPIYLHRSPKQPYEDRPY